MLARVGIPSSGRQASACAALAVLATLAGCGSGTGAPQLGAIAGMSCPQTVLYTLGRVVSRVYHEGVLSERTLVARRSIAHAAPLREAVERDDATAAGSAARSLVAGGRITNLLVRRGAHVLADAGGPALAPLSGTIADAHGAPLASYVTSVWSDEGFLAESRGISQGEIALHAHGRSVGGSFRLPPGRLAREGTLRRGRLLYQFTSFAATAYPSGAMHVFVLRPRGSTLPLCGRSSEATLVNTLASIARLIYAGEAGDRTLPQLRRVQRDPALLAAVARGDAAGARRAIDALLTQHIVRLRVYTNGRLLDDVGGPYVLAPVSAPLRLNGRTIGRFVLSIQDDEGYLRLTRRLVGLPVLMYMGSQLVKNSLGPAPGPVPQAGRYAYRGRSFRVVTLHAQAFPSGPLLIKVLVPLPYS